MYSAEMNSLLNVHISLIILEKSLFFGSKSSFKLCFISCRSYTQIVIT